MVDFLCTDEYMNIWIHSHCIEWNINRIDGRLLEAVVLKYRKIKLNRYKAQLIKTFPFLLALTINITALHYPLEWYAGPCWYHLQLVANALYIIVGLIGWWV